MLGEIRDLGFEFAELSHGTRVSLLPGILDAVDAGEIRISSLHNFCPLPMGVNYSAPNLYEFSAAKSRERELAHRYTLKTIEFAARLHAPAVVLHMGSIEMRNYTDKLLGLMERKPPPGKKIERLSARLAQKREAKKEPFVERTHEMLRRLLPEAETRGIKLGVENRQALEELPLDSDFQFFFRDFPSPNVVYWHDTGHAQIKENLGFIHHAMHLESLRARLAGFHVHDVEFPGHDHRAPGTGTVDFAALKPLVKPEHIKVFEFSPNLNVEELKRGVAHVKNFWGDE